MTKSQLIHTVALGSIGKDMGLDDIPNAVSCAISVNNIVERATGKAIGGGASTYLMRQALKNGAFRFNPWWRFVRVSEENAQPGDILICATGTGNGSIPGHTGIVTDGRRIISNDSRTGKMQNNYSFESWKARYVDIGGFPMEFYRLIR